MGRRADRQALAEQRAATLPADTLEAQRRAAEGALLREDGSLGAVQADAVRRHLGEQSTTTAGRPEVRATRRSK